jgi:hypothetical protein
MRNLYLVVFQFTIIGILAARDALGSQQAEDRFVYVENGRLYHPDGREVALFGVNLQPMVSWEYNALIKKAGIAKDADTWKTMVDDALDELEIINCRVFRVHLTPADFTHSDGHLVQTIYLDMLDYTLSEAARRGIYSYITLLNHMGYYEVQQSFMQASYLHAKSISDSEWQTLQKALLMFDPGYLASSRNYIDQLLSRVNPYSGVAYNADTSIVAWEIMNEPTYMDYALMKLYSDEYGRYQAWLTDSGRTEQGGLYYPEYRKTRVLEYINGMYEAVKDGGARQPVGWNCNWHRMINGREEVFEAIAESKMEVVSFCNYPGQGEASQNGPYWDHPIDLTRYDFSSWFRNCYENRDWYGWALEPRFAGKAKVVYEFETFYNQSAYLYPVMTDFFRSMGVQVAAMWHYSLPGYAHKRNGSHMLNLKCTPRKAASFVVASKLFENQPLLEPYPPASTTERVTGYYMYSYRKDLSVFSSDEEYIYSGTHSPAEMPAPRKGITHVLGYGSSPVVKYCGSGVYDVAISGNRIEIHIEPNAGWLRPPWERDDLKFTVTALDYERLYLMELRLDGWEGNSGCTLFRVEEGDKIAKPFIGKYLRFAAKPGDYLIERTSN